MRALLLSALAVLTAGAAPAAPRPGSGLLLLRDVRVVPMDRERVLPGQDVLVRGDRIAELRPTGGPVPAGARVLEGRGRFLAPGLADMHVHLYDGEGLEGFLAHGVTTVVDLNGSPAMLALREEVRRGVRHGPTLLVSSPSVNGYPPGNSSFHAVESARDARAAVAAAARAGYDLMKLYSTLPWPAYQAALEEARSRGLAVAGHVPWDGGLERALASGLDLVAHAEELLAYLQAGGGDAEARIPVLVAMVRASGAAVNPNLFPFQDYLRWVEDFEATLAGPELGQVGLAAFSEKLRTSNRSVRDDPVEFAASLRKGSTLMAKATLALSRAGVPLVLGTDTEVFGAAGDSAVRELEALVAAGLTPFEALATGTRAAGELAVRRLRSAPFGVVAPGQRADLVLLGTNPLERVDAYRTAEVVIVRGEVLEAAELARRSEARLARDAPLRARLVELDRQVAAGDLAAAAEGYLALGRERPVPPPVSQAALRNAIVRALDARDEPARLRLAEAWVGLFPRSHAARLARADAAAAAGDRTTARRLYGQVAAELPFEARPRRRLAELDAAAAPLRCEPAGRWRLLVLEGRRQLTATPATLEVAGDGPRWTGTLTVGGRVYALPTGVAGGDRLVLRGRVEGEDAELTLVVRGDRVDGGFAAGFGRNHAVSGRREKPGNQGPSNE